SAGRDNGDHCDAPAPPALPEDATFKRFDWPKRWPAFDGPLLLTELALRPAKFVEVQNIGDTKLSLADYALRIAPSGPGVDWPGPNAGTALTWPVDELA